MFKSFGKGILFLFIVSVGFVACDRPVACYDEELHEKHKNDICTMVCTGVTGCDGKTYCNECIARSQGIRVK